MGDIPDIPAISGPGEPTANAGVVAAHQYRGLEVRRVGGALDRVEYGITDDRHHLFLLRSGSAIAIDADGERFIKPSSFCWMPQGSTRSVRQPAGSDGVLISIPDRVLAHCVGDDATSGQILQVFQQEQLIRVVPDQPFQTILNHIELLEQELFENKPGASIVLYRTIGIVVVLLWRFCEYQSVTGVPVPRNLVNTFFSLLDAHLQEHWSVADYARHMGVSRDRLTTVLERATGQKPLQLIHGRMIEQARLLLTTSNQQVAQIAFTLGYADPAYFNRFFRRQAGVTPARYRRQAMQSRERDDVSFSAWP